MVKKAVRTLSMFALFVLASSLPFSPQMFADTLGLSLNIPVQSGAAGSTVSFAATVSAPGTNSGTVFLNGDSFDVSLPLTFDDSGFLFDFPLSLNPGDSFSGTLFSIDLPANVAAGLYTGSFTILGGADSGTLDSLASVGFQVNVAPVANAVPEPESLILLAAGLPGVALVARKRSRLFLKNKK